jgi:hypothetical protein
MKRTLLLYCLMLAAVPSFAQSTFQSFTPRYEADGTTYLNAEVVRVNTDGTMALRSESGDLELTADSRAVPGLTGLRRGEKVLIAYDTLTADDGRARRIVTYARQASPTSGEPEPSIAIASASATGSTVRVNSADRDSRTGVRQASLSSGVARTAVLPVGSPAGASQAGATAPGTGVPGGGTFSPMGAGIGLPVVGVAVPGIIPPGSPYASTVPSIPSPTAMFNPVLPAAVAKAPVGNEDVGVLRAYGERDLDAAAVVLAAYANEIDGHWFRFVNGCLAGFIPGSSAGRQWFLLLDGRVPTPTDDSCRSQYTSILGTATGWEQQLAIALDAARRVDVLPGRIREILDRHRIDR